MTTIKDGNVSRIASFPMYDCFIPYESSDKIWDSIVAGCDNKDDLPAQLDRFGSCESAWTAGESLVLTQTCGYPLIHSYQTNLSVVGTPVYNAEGCEGPRYRAAIIISSSVESVDLKSHLESKKSLTIAVNSLGSFSGWLMLLSKLSDIFDGSTNLCCFCTKILLTGSHLGSMKAVKNGQADLASIDCVSLALARLNHDKKLLEGIRVVDYTDQAPALPLVTHYNASRETIMDLRKGLTNMLHSQDPDVVDARNRHLLLDIDMSENVTKETYAKCVFSFIYKVQKIVPTFAPFLLENPQDSIYSLAAEEDRKWPVSDFEFLQILSNVLFNFLIQELHKIVTSIVQGEQEITEEDCLPENFISLLSRLSKEQCDSVKQEIIKHLVGKILWQQSPHGGKVRIVLPSLFGILQLCLHSNAAKTQEMISTTDPSYVLFMGASADLSDDVDTSTPPSSKDGCIAHPTTESTTVGSTAAEAIKMVDALHPESRKQEIRDALWTADIALMETLCNPVSPSNNQSHDGAVRDEGQRMQGEAAAECSAAAASEVFAYVSSARHNDRGDWGNLVVVAGDDSIKRFSESALHARLVKAISPLAYRNIRIHRGKFTGCLHSYGKGGKKKKDDDDDEGKFNGLTHRVQIEQTIFLGSLKEEGVPDADDLDPCLLKNANVELLVREQSFLNVLDKKIPTAPTNMNIASDHKKVKEFLLVSRENMVKGKRKLVKWTEIDKNDNLESLPGCGGLNMLEARGLLGFEEKKVLNTGEVEKMSINPYVYIN